MLKATYKKSGEYYISYEEFENIKILYNKDKNSFSCPLCKGDVIFVDGNKTIKHFRHKVESNCSTEPETKIHLEMKKFIKDKFKLSSNEIEYTKLLSVGIKPDAFIESERIAIEVQHSNISEKKFISRNIKYRNNNIHVIWIFDDSLLRNNLPRLLRKAHELYYGRIYVYNYENKKICPVHFVPIQRWISEYEGHGGYFSFYKNKKDYKFGGIIENFKLKKSHNKWKGNDFLIASFNDKKFWDKEENKIVEVNNFCNNMCSCGKWKSPEYDECYECSSSSGGYY